VEQIHDRVAGLDVHRDVVAVCARWPGPRGGTVTEKHRFPTTAAALARLGGWLADRMICLVAMEATGVYWKPVVRHEALGNRAGVRGLRCWPVAAGW
jgi:transposase